MTSAASTTQAADIQEMGRKARAAARALARKSGKARRDALLRLAGLLIREGEAVAAENRKDIDAARAAGIPDNGVDRLLLTPERIEALANTVRGIADLDDPVGEIVEETTRPNGLRLQRRRIPLGVIGAIYESRPNVTVDIASLGLKTGNAVILRGGSEAFESNRKLASLVREAVAEAGLPEDAVQLVASKDRVLVDEMLGMSDHIDLLIPRGGAALIRMVAEKAKMPAVTGGIGVCHTYVDATADLEKAVAIVHNAKVQRPSVCNALDTVLVHSEIAGRFLPMAAQSLWASGVTLKCDRRARTILEPAANRGGHASSLTTAGEGDFDTEFLGLTAAVAVVDSLEEALAHIDSHGSNHSEAIVTEDPEAMDRFLREVDASGVFANTSTRFNDGEQFGLGAEVAISTNKMHAYGPMGPREIMSTKWVAIGDGQVRA